MGGSGSALEVEGADVQFWFAVGFGSVCDWKQAIALSTAASTSTWVQLSICASKSSHMRWGFWRNRRCICILVIDPGLDKWEIPLKRKYSKERFCG